MTCRPRLAALAVTVAAIEEDEACVRAVRRAVEMSSPTACMPLVLLSSCLLSLLLVLCDLCRDFCVLFVFVCVLVVRDAVLLLLLLSLLIVAASMLSLASARGIAEAEEEEEEEEEEEVE